MQKDSASTSFARRRGDLQEKKSRARISAKAKIYLAASSFVAQGRLGDPLKVAKRAKEDLSILFHRKLE